MHADFIYKYGSEAAVEHKIARLINEHVFHYKAYVGNPQSEVLMLVILAFARKATSKSLPFLLAQLRLKFEAVKSNAKRCEMIVWSLVQLLPAAARLAHEPEAQRQAADEASKLISAVFEGWTASKQQATRHWAALALHQMRKHALPFAISQKALGKIDTLLDDDEWDCDELTGGVFPIFDDLPISSKIQRQHKKRKKKRGAKKKGKKLSAKEQKRRRQRLLRKGRDQQYKMYAELDDAGQEQEH